MGVAASEIKGELNWKLAKLSKSGDDEILKVPYVFKGYSFSKNERILKSGSDLPIMVDLMLRNDNKGNIEGFLKISAFKDNTNNSLREKYISYYTVGMKRIVDKLVTNSRVSQLKLVDVGIGVANRVTAQVCEELSYTVSYIESCTGGMNNTVCVFVKRTVKRMRCSETMEHDPLEWSTELEPGEPGGGSWTEHDEEVEVYQNQHIIDSLQGYPCAQAVLQQMPNINSQINNLLQTYLQAEMPVDIRFRVNPNLSGTLTSGQTLDIKIENGRVVSIVEMNPDILNRATKEYILLTFMHESIHAYMDYQWRLLQTHQMDTATFISKFPIYWDYRRILGSNSTELGHHMQMSETYIAFMSNALMSFNPNISSATARYLSWEGLRETTLWFNNLADTNVVNNRIGIARDTTVNNAGVNMYGFSKCP